MWHKILSSVLIVLACATLQSCLKGGERAAEEAPPLSGTAPTTITPTPGAVTQTPLEGAAVDQGNKEPPAAEGGDLEGVAKPTDVFKISAFAAVMQSFPKEVNMTLYDDKGKEVKETYTFEYGNSNNPITITNKSGFKSVSNFDEKGRLVSVSNNKGEFDFAYGTGKGPYSNPIVTVKPTGGKPIRYIYDYTPINGHHYEVWTEEFDKEWSESKKYVEISVKSVTLNSADYTFPGIVKIYSSYAYDVPELKTIDITMDDKSGAITGFGISYPSPLQGFNNGATVKDTDSDGYRDMILIKHTMLVAPTIVRGTWEDDPNASGKKRLASEKVWVCDDAQCSGSKLLISRQFTYEARPAVFPMTLPELAVPALGAGFAPGALPSVLFIQRADAWLGNFGLGLAPLF